MYIRFHRGQYCDCIVPTAIGTIPDASPADTVIYIASGDINPTKTVSESRNVQATDASGNPLYNADGTPQWATQTVDGVDVPVTESVDVTYSLMDNPTTFTPDDIAVVAPYTVVGSLDHAKQLKISELGVAYAKALSEGFQSNPDGTGSRTFGFSSLDEQHWDLIRGMITAGTCPNPVQVKDIAGNRVLLTPEQATTLCNDAQTFYLTTYGHWDSKEKNVQDAASESDVNAISW